MEHSTLILFCKPSVAEQWRAWFEEEGYRVAFAGDAAEAIELQRRRGAALTVADVDDVLAAGVSFVRALFAVRPQAEVLLIGPPSSGQASVAAMKAGAADLLFHPVERAPLLAAVHDVLGAYQTGASERRLWRELRQRFDFAHIVAHSSQMLHVLTLAGRVAPTDASVLITGESGTGKELLARAIHQNSSRRQRPMLSINCAAIPESLLESELFGYRRGAFTGAHGDKPGLLAVADGGTLFLDEVADLALATQAKLLRFLQEGSYFPVGSAAPHSADVRVLAATNADVEAVVRKASFRHDLFYRLSVFPLHIAPLRDRREDIIPLARSFVQRTSDKSARKPPQITREVARHLLSRSWPGNVRELENAVERAVILCDGNRLTAADFRLLDAATAGETAKVWELPDQGVDLPELNRRFVAAALERTQYNVSAAARLLGLSRPALRYRMEKYGLRAPTLAA